MTPTSTTDLGRRPAAVPGTDDADLDLLLRDGVIDLTVLERVLDGLGRL